MSGKVKLVCESNLCGFRFLERLKTDSHLSYITWNHVTMSVSCVQREATAHRDCRHSASTRTAIIAKGDPMTERTEKIGPVEIAIRATVHEGDCLTTPTQSKPFCVAKMSGHGIVLEFGEKRTATPFTWACLEGVLPFLEKHGRVPITGSGMSQDIVQGTLDAYLKRYVNRFTASYIAALLEKARVVTIDRTRPAHVSAAVK